MIALYIVGSFIMLILILGMYWDMIEYTTVLPVKFAVKPKIVENSHDIYYIIYWRTILTPWFKMRYEYLSKDEALNLISNLKAERADAKVVRDANKKSKMVKI